MARRRSAVDAEIDELYTRIPDAGCKGLCVDACGPVEMTGRERDRFEERTRIRIPTGDEGMRRLREEGVRHCPALDELGHCRGYEVRPLICRLYAAVETPALTCPYGCVPENPLSEADARALVTEMTAIAGRDY